MGDIAGFGGSMTLPGDKFDPSAIQEWSASLTINGIKVEPAFGEKWTITALGAGELTGSFRAKLRRNIATSQPFDVSGADWSNFAVAGAVLSVDTTATSCGITADIVVMNVNVTRPHLGAPPVLTADFANSSTNVAVSWDQTP